MYELNWLLLLEYLKVLLSWPPIALIIAIIFIARFRSAINNFLDRVIEGNFFGQVLKAAPPHQPLEPGGAMEDRLIKAAEAQPHTSVQPTVGVLVPLPPELANDPLAQAAIDWVRNNPAQTVIEYKQLLFKYSSERLFNVIYGTQIALLEFLAAHPVEPITLAQLAQFHREHQSKAARTDYQLQDYVNFLASYTAIAVAGPPHQQTYSITQYGVEFLSYIKANYPVSWNQRAF